MYELKVSKNFSYNAHSIPATTAPENKKRGEPLLSKTIYSVRSILLHGASSGYI